MGIADAVFFVFRKQFAVSTVKAGGKIKVIELSAEVFVFFGIPNVGQRLLLDTAETAVGDLTPHIVHVGIAVAPASANPAAWSANTS